MNYRKPLIIAALTATGDKTYERLKFIRHIDSRPLTEKKKYQKQKLISLLLHAYNHVPYYREMLPQAGVINGNQIDLDRFSDIPPLTKTIIRQQGDRLYSDDHNRRKYYRNTSGGSTGEPVEFLQDREYSEWNIANKIFYKSFAEQEIGNRELRLWGSERDVLVGRDKLSLRVRNRIFNRLDMNAFRMSDTDMKRYVAVWNAYRPQWVEAYAQSMYEFAHFVRKRKHQMHVPRGILTSAGTLYPEMEREIREVFGCAVFNRYGSREVGDMACSDGSDKGLRISSWNNYLEILEDDGRPCATSERGTIHVTNLNNYSMPLIRFNIDDVGVMGDNPGYLKEVVGRLNGIIRTAKGAFDGAGLPICFYPFNSIKRYQLIQKKRNLIVLKVELKNVAKWNGHDSTALKSKLHNLFGNDVTIEFEICSEILPTASGKYQYIINESV